MSIWEYANPKKFMQTSGVLLPWVTALAVLALGVGRNFSSRQTPTGSAYRQDHICMCLPR
jgi:heme exporter protein C